MRSSGVLLRLSESLRGTWRTQRPSAADDRANRANESTPEQLFLRARALYRLGDTANAIQLLRQASEIDPAFSDAIEAEGEALDTRGDIGGASVKYAEARRLRQITRAGAPDRHFVFRQQGPHTAEIISYTMVLKSLQKSALPQMARGNAYLADRQPELALADYERALKLRPDLPDAMAMKGEALSAMGKYAAAIEIFDRVFAAGLPVAPHVLNARGIAHMALGHIDQANADWQLQLELSRGRPAPSAYLALRLASYEVAIPHLEAALQADPLDPYWKLYLQTAKVRTGQQIAAREPVAKEGWPETLLAFQAGAVDEGAVLAQADTSARRAEALFQIAVLKSVVDPAAARVRWQEVVEQGPRDLVEYAAARNELARSL